MLCDRVRVTQSTAGSSIKSVSLGPPFCLSPSKSAFTQESKQESLSASDASWK